MATGERVYVPAEPLRVLRRMMLNEGYPNEGQFIAYLIEYKRNGRKYDILEAFP